MWPSPISTPTTPAWPRRSLGKPAGFTSAGPTGPIWSSRRRPNGPTPMPFISLRAFRRSCWHKTGPTPPALWPPSPPAATARWNPALCWRRAAAGSPACPRPVTPLASSASGTSRTAFSLPATTCSLTSAPISRLGTAWRTPWDAIWTACGPCGSCPPAWLCPATAAPVRWPPGWTPCWSTTPAAWTS